jgi:hypothetical protein
MSVDAERLYQMLPAVYRLRDAAQGEPLRQLLEVIGVEFAALEENLAQLYDDQFIETCADWAAPYLGELIGYRSLHGVAPRIASPRAEVANTIAFRRRKGTALMLEELSRNVTGWPAHAVEFFEQLATTQFMKHLRAHAPATAGLRSQRAMLSLGGAFNTVAHTAQMRRAETGGRYNIPNIGIFLWRLAPYGLRNLPLVADAGDTTGRRFRVNPLGADLALFRAPRREDDIDQLAGAANVPEPLRIRELARQVREATRGTQRVAAAADYGAGASVLITREGIVQPLREAGAAPPGDPHARLVVRIADLRDVRDAGGTVTGWAHEDDIAATQIGLDPERGRVLLGSALVPLHAEAPYRATFHYGFARDIGGGDYERTPAVIAGDATAPQTAADGESLLPPLATLGAQGGRLVIQDSRTYAAPASIQVPAGSSEQPRTVVIGAANGERPLLQATGDLLLDIGAEGTLILDGLVIAGGTLKLLAAADNARRTLLLRDCTLVPGLARNADGSPVSPGAPSLVVEHPFTDVRLERCITGALRAVAEADVTLRLDDCIVDAAGEGATAYAGVLADARGAEITLQDCTVIGVLDTELLRLGSNCIFTAPVHAGRRQEGCLRFSFVPTGSVTPRRFRCLPDAAHPDARPQFTSLRYGHPGYCQLRSATEPALREGADDGGEMGVMHALHQPQRETNLRIRLDEYLRFGLRAGLFYAT